MQALFKGIYAQFASTSTGGYKAFYNDVNGQLYFTEAPSSATFPYAVYFLVGESHDWQFQTDYVDADIQFNLFSSSEEATQITNMYEDLKATFDDCVLTCTGYSHVYMIRNFAQLMKFPTEIPDKSIWQYSVEYNVYLKKN
jgi:hypothetical protein